MTGNGVVERASRRHHRIVIGLVLPIVLGLVACGGPAPPAPESRSGVDGVWDGETSQGQQFQVVVADDYIESFGFGFDSPGCGGDSPVNVYYGTPTYRVDSDGSFELVDAGLYRLEVSGHLDPDGTAAGETSIDLSSCGEGVLRLTWSASWSGS